jgi:integrase/recombinase XerD
MTARTMVKIRLKYLVEDFDRHGNVRLYVRVRGKKKIRIREQFGTDAFMTAYHAAIAGKLDDPRNARKAKRGSLSHLCQLYYGSPRFLSYDLSTQSWQRHALDLICEQHGEKPAALLQAKHVRKLRDDLRDTPAAANKRLKALQALFSWACEDEEDLAPSNPTLGVKKIHYATNGHHSWTVDEIDQFKATHPLGTRPRLAMDLLRFTTGRREDAVRFGPQHVRNGRVKFRQAKNEHRSPVDIDLPLHPELNASIEALPSGHLTFLVTAHGKPFTPAGFGNAMRDWCDQANLRHCSAHGLRKATPTQMAEEGATPHELMAVTGHRSLHEVERYTRAAQNRKLADSAMARLKG